MLNKQKTVSYLLKMNLYCLNSHVEHIWPFLKANLELWSPISMWYFYCILLRTPNKCKYETKSPSIILNLNERINRKIKQISCKFLNEAIVDYKKNWFRSHDTTFKNCWCIWPTMKIHADTDSTSSNFSHFFCYTLSPTLFNVKRRIWPPSIVKQIIFHFFATPGKENLGVSLLQSLRKLF